MMAVQTIEMHKLVQTAVQGRSVRRPAFPLADRFLLTARAHGLLDAVQGRAARPAAFGRQAGAYYAAYLSAAGCLPAR